MGGYEMVEQQTNNTEGRIGAFVQSNSIGGEERGGGAKFIRQEKNKGDDHPLQCLDDHKGLHTEPSEHSIGTASIADSVEEGSIGSCHQKHTGKESEKNSRAISDAKFNKIDIINDVSPPLLHGKFLGSGGYANVYKSFYGAIPVAIKFFHHQNSLDSEQKDDFQRELSIISKLDHKNIVKFYGASLQPGNRALVMEYVEYNLLEMIKSKKSMNMRENANEKFPLKKIFKIVQAIASALEYLHSQMIAHRDLHPSNVLISQDGCVKVADMGISKILEHSTTANTTQSAMVRYQAPEIFKNKINCKSDIYSLGVIALELWSLEGAWKNFGEGLVCQETSRGERPEIPHDMPQNLQELITNCWQQDYKKRTDASYVVQECEIELEILDQISYEKR